MQFINFNELYYETYTETSYPQLELKHNRPYLVVNVDGKQWAIPLRSHITHNNCYYTNRKKQCGLDYSKAVPFEERCVNQETLGKIYIRSDEYTKIAKGMRQIVAGFKMYLNRYAEAKINPDCPHREQILKYSSLQYFEDCL